MNQGGIAPIEALYIVFIGGNDVRDARDTSDFRSGVRTVTQAVKTEGRQIQKLIDTGAQHIMVYNVADIGRIPDTTLAALAANDDRLIRRATQFTRFYNILLRLRLRILEIKNHIDLIEFDFFNEFSYLLDNPAEFGFTNSTQACFSQITFTFNPDCNFGVNFPQFIFFDEIHPTARTHALLGHLAATEVREQLDKEEQDDSKRNPHTGSPYELR